MALTATLSADQSSVVSGQRVNFVLGVANTTGAQVTVSGIAIQCSPVSSSWSGGSILITPSTSLSITNGVTAEFTFDEAFWSQPLLPVAVAATGTEETAYTIVALTTMSDGTVVVSSTVTVQVSPATQTYSGVQFSPWLYGEARFEFLQASYLIPVLL